MKIWKKTLAIKSLSHITKAYIFYLYQNTAEKKKKEQWVGEQQEKSDSGLQLKPIDQPNAPASSHLT